MRDLNSGILTETEKRHEFYMRLIKFTKVVMERGLRMVFENPFSVVGYLHNNFPKEPDIIDKDRNAKGDFFTKPTGYWFWNCEPCRNRVSEQKDEERKKVWNAKSSDKAGLCSMERSMISSDYARNWICDYILDIEQPGISTNLFDETKGD